MIKYGWICLILGGLLALPLDVGVDVETLSTWQLATLSLASALGPFLVAIGFDAIADRSGGGPVRSFLQVGGIGLLILGGIEVAAVVLPLTGYNHAGAQVRSTHFVAAGLVILGGAGAGLLLIRRWTLVAIPLLTSTAALVVTVLPQTQWWSGHTYWAISCVLLGLALRLSRLR